MAKKIRLTQGQVKMLKENKVFAPTNKVVRITEAQYNRLFNDKKINENRVVAEGPVTDFVLENMELIIEAIRTLVRNQSQDGLDQIFLKLGITWGDFAGVLTDLGVLTIGVESGRRVYKISKKLFVKYSKEIINDLCGPTFGSDGKLIKKDGPEQTEEGMMLGNDIEESGYPDGASDDPNAPYNRDDRGPRKAEHDFFQHLDDVRDGEYTLLFMRGEDGGLYVTIFSPKSTHFQEYCGGGDVSIYCVMEQLNAQVESGELDIQSSELVEFVDDNMKEYIDAYHCDNPEVAQKIHSIINGMAETTTAGSVGGSFEAPMGGQSPLKRNFNLESTEEDLDETTMSGDATGSYVQPQIWAKDKKNWRHGSKTMYPNGTIVNEALQLRRTKVQDNQGNEISALAVVSDQQGKDGRNETFKNKNQLKKAGFAWGGDFWYIAEDQFDSAKETLSAVNKIEYLIDKLDNLEDLIQNAEEGPGTKKELLMANIEQYVMDLTNATDARAMSAEITRYLTFFANFHQYSFHNRMLIYLQRPTATKVGSYAAWQKSNRQVRKGAKGITILVPIFDKYKKKGLGNDMDDEPSDDSQRLRGFKTGNVFDVADTDATSEEGEIPQSPQWWADNEPSELAEELRGYVTELGESMGISITKGDAMGGERGYSAGDHINLSSDVEGVSEVSTLIHEIAHELMHWKEKSIYYVGDEVRGDKAMLELHADSVSYVVLTHFGLPTKKHPTYLALWGANKDKIKSQLGLISKVAQFIIKQIEAIAGKKINVEGINEKMIGEMLDRTE